MKLAVGADETLPATYRGFGDVNAVMIVKQRNRVMSFKVEAIMTIPVGVWIVYF